MEITFKGSVEELAELMPKPLEIDASFLEERDISAEWKKQKMDELVECARRIKAYCTVQSNRTGCKECLFCDDPEIEYCTCHLLRQTPRAWRCPATQTKEANA